MNTVRPLLILASACLLTAPAWASGPCVNPGAPAGCDSTMPMPPHAMGSFQANGPSPESPPINTFHVPFVPTPLQNQPPSGTVVIEPVPGDKSASSQPNSEAPPVAEEAQR